MVELVDGGQIGDEAGERFDGFDSSILQMTGGYVGDDIFTHHSAMLFMTVGMVNSGFDAFDSSELFVSDGRPYRPPLRNGAYQRRIISGTSDNYDSTPRELSLRIFRTLKNPLFDLAASPWGDPWPIHCSLFRSGVSTSISSCRRCRSRRIRSISATSSSRIRSSRASSSSWPLFQSTHM